MTSYFKKDDKTPEFEIKLSEYRYYFPGETIAGVVRLRLLKQTNTTSIRIRFYGEVQTFIKGHQTMKVFDLEQVMLGRGAQPGSISNLLGAEDVKKEKSKKSEIVVMEARLHTFPFEFKVPEVNIPSTMELYKEGTIRYAIQAIHEKANVLESRIPKVEVNVPIIERIDVNEKEYLNPREEIKEIPMENGMKAAVRVRVPKMGYVRGEPIPITVEIQHVKSFHREKGISINLLRTGQFVTNKHISLVTHTVVTTTHNIDIPPANALTQTIMGKFLVPTNTPPTIDTNGKIIYIQYKVVIDVNLEPNSSEKDTKEKDSKDKTRKGSISVKSNETSSQHSACVQMEIPIVVGTWPFAAVPIDIDIDEDDSDAMGEEGLGYESESADAVNTLRGRRGFYGNSALGRSASDAVRSIGNKINNMYLSEQSYQNTRSNELSKSLSSPDLRLSRSRSRGPDKNIDTIVLEEITTATTQEGMATDLSSSLPQPPSSQRSRAEGLVKNSQWFNRESATVPVPAFISMPTPETYINQALDYTPAPPPYLLPSKSSSIRPPNSSPLPVSTLPPAKPSFYSRNERSSPPPVPPHSPSPNVLSFPELAAPSIVLLPMEEKEENKGEEIEESKSNEKEEDRDEEKEEDADQSIEQDNYWANDSDDDASEPLFYLAKKNRKKQDFLRDQFIITN